MRSSIVVICFLFGVVNCVELNNINTITEAEGVLNDCQACKLFKEHQAKASAGDELANHLTELCAKAPVAYRAVCEVLTAKTAARIGNSLDSNPFALSDCSSFCDVAEPSHEHLCTIAKNLHANMEKHVSTLLDDAVDYCKTEANPLKCMERIKKLSPLAARTGKNLLLRAISIIDKENLCGVETTINEKAVKIVKPKVDVALPMKCSFCLELCNFMTQAINIKSIDDFVGGIVAGICKALHLGDLLKIDCSQIPALLPFVFESVLCPPAPNGGTLLCHMLYPDCPDPNA